MVTWLYIIAGWFGADALVVVARTGKVLRITPSVSVLTVITHGVMITVLVLAAMRLAT